MKVKSIFSNGAVFPAKKPIRIYGESDTEVEIVFGDTKKTVVPENGKFMAEFSPMEYGGPYEIRIKSGEESLTVSDVYVGEVLLMSGQSNMAFKMEDGRDDYTSDKDDDLLRIYTADHIIFTDGELQPFRSSDGWVKCKKENIGGWISLGYQVGKMIRAEKGCAVGILSCSQGASTIETWLPSRAFESGELDLDESKKHYDHQDMLYRIWNEPSRLHDLTLSQVFPYSLTAAVWYQGESDTTEAEGEIYDKELCALICCWREDFCNPTLPFVIVQIADFDVRDDEGWHAVQKAQVRAVEKTEKTVLVISKDVSETDTIHPTKKAELAKRIAKNLSVFIKL